MCCTVIGLVCSAILKTLSKKARGIKEDVLADALEEHSKFILIQILFIHVNTCFKTINLSIQLYSKYSLYLITNSISQLPTILHVVLLLISKIQFQNFWTTMHLHFGQNKRRKYKASDRCVAQMHISLGYLLQSTDICLRKLYVWCISAHMFQEICGQAYVKQISN